MNCTSNEDVFYLGDNYDRDQEICQQLRQRFCQIYPVEQWKTEGFFTDEDLFDIDCHWLRFGPVRPMVHFSLAIVYVIFFLVGSVSNILVICVIISSKKLLTPANILLVNLAVSDLLIVSTVPIFIFNSFQQGPAAGKYGCWAYGFITGLSGTCSIMSLTAVAMDRYLVIGRPLKLDKKPTRCWAYVTVLLTWLYSSVLAGLPLLGVGKYVPEGYLTSCSFDYLSQDWETRTFILSFFVAAWVCPLSFSTFAYSAIIRAVIYVRKNVVTGGNGNIDQNDQPEPPSQHSSVNSAKIHQVNFRSQHRGINQPNLEVTIAKIVIGLIGAWMVAWTPYALVALAGISGYAHLITPFNAMLPAMFAKTAACVDPFIYSLNHPKIRQEIFFRLYHRFFPAQTTSGAGTNMACSRRIESTTGQQYAALVVSNAMASANNSPVIPKNKFASFNLSHRNQSSRWRTGCTQHPLASSILRRPTVPSNPLHLGQQCRDRNSGGNKVLWHPHLHARRDTIVDETGRVQVLCASISSAGSRIYSRSPFNSDTPADEALLPTHEKASAFS